MKDMNDKVLGKEERQQNMKGCNVIMGQQGFSTRSARMYVNIRARM